MSISSTMLSKFRSIYVLSSYEWAKLWSLMLDFGFTSTECDSGILNGTYYGSNCRVLYFDLLFCRGRFKAIDCIYRIGLIGGLVCTSYFLCYVGDGDRIVKKLLMYLSNYYIVYWFFGLLYSFIALNFGLPFINLSSNDISVSLKKTLLKQRN